MFETMYAAPGVGLAAVQVGVPKRLFVMDCSGGKDPQQRVALDQPGSTARRRELRMATKAVCRFPGIFTPVERNLRAIVRAQDLKGEWFELDGMELTARCMLARNRSLRWHRVSRQDERHQTRDRKTQD